MDWRSKPAYRNGSTMHQIDSKSIEPSRWNYPDECEFQGERFRRLKASIESWGGNLQPIQLRHGTEPGIDRDTAVATGKHFESEIVFGHARHRACLELGLPVLIMSDRMSDLDALQMSAMELHGDHRWRPWRLARIVRCSLDSGRFPTLRTLATSLSMDLSETKLLYELGQLPESVRLAYGDLDLNPTHAKKLIEIHSKRPHLLVANAASQSFRSCKSASSVLALLTQVRA